MKLLISDIDGTLIPFGVNEMAPEMIAFAKSLPARGVRMTFATGKPFDRALPIAMALDITTPLICANGALIRDPLTHATLFRCPLSSDLTEDILRVCDDPRYQCYFELNDGLFYLENDAIPAHAWRHARPGWKIPTPHRKGEPVAKRLGDTPHKIAISVAPQDLDALEENLRTRFGHTANIFSPKPDVVDITSIEVDKGTAAVWLANHLQIDRRDVIAIGDELNDLSLFQAAGMSIAMPDAPPALKAVATHVLNQTHSIPDQLDQILPIA